MSHRKALSSLSNFELLFAKIVSSSDILNDFIIRFIPYFSNKHASVDEVIQMLKKKLFVCMYISIINIKCHIITC